jgi:two-component system CheB/CheR fusion protein
MRSAAEKDFRIACLGGSAGSLAAYTEILRRMPADTGMALVIASHRRSDKPSLLSQIIARASTMPVIEVEEGVALEPNHVYLMPPGMEMTLKNNEFSSSHRERRQAGPLRSAFSCFLSPRRADNVP